jgi:hypothetical protein
MPKIEIDLADLGLPTGQSGDGEPYGSMSLTDLIVEAGVRKVFSEENISHEIKQQISSKVGVLVDEKVEALVTEAFAAPIQRTTSWGEKQGEPTSVLEIIRESVEKYVKAPASNDRYSNSTKNLTELIEASTKNLLDRDFTEYLKQVKEGIKVSVHRKALDAAVAELQK